MKTGLALIFVVILLIGCSGESNDPSAPQPTQKSSLSLQFKVNFMGIGL